MFSPHPGFLCQEVIHGSLYLVFILYIYSANILRSYQVKSADLHNHGQSDVLIWGQDLNTDLTIQRKTCFIFTWLWMWSDLPCFRFHLKHFSPESVAWPGTFRGHQHPGFSLQRHSRATDQDRDGEGWWTLSTSFLSFLFKWNRLIRLLFQHNVSCINAETRGFFILAF